MIKVKELAEKLHIWYLKATCELSLDSYNPKAQKPYSELTDEQQFIDLYIAQSIYNNRKKLGLYTLEDIESLKITT